MTQLSTLKFVSLSSVLEFGFFGERLFLSSVPNTLPDLHPMLPKKTSPTNFCPRIKLTS